ncbi:hypothetical protein GCM10009554_52610 [Kribbella koreensis]|uniref:DoxX-like protein n=1 Tax=Kribbella koreensis TaxID=57909 RepID=A0ABP4BKX5_9ACTN
MVSVIAVRRTQVWLPIAVACMSLALGAYGVARLLSADPLGIEEFAGLFGVDALGLSFVPKRVDAGAVAVLGLIGVPAAVGHARTEWSPSAYRPLLWFTAVEVVAAVGLLLAPGAAVTARVLAVALAAGWTALGIRGLRYTRTT